MFRVSARRLGKEVLRSPTSLDQGGGRATRAQLPNTLDIQVPRQRGPQAPPCTLTIEEGTMMVLGGSRAQGVSVPFIRTG